MNATQVLAAYGALVSTICAIIQYTNYRNNKPGLIIKQDHASYSYFFKPEEFGMSGYQTKYAAVISLKISNSSALPITLDEIYVKHENIKRVNHYAFGLNLKNIKVGNTFYEYAPSPKLKLPQRIQAYDTVYGSVRIPFVDNAVINNEINDLTIVIETPRQDYSYTVSLLEYDALHESRQKKKT